MPTFGYGFGTYSNQTRLIDGPSFKRFYGTSCSGRKGKKKGKKRK